MNKEVLKFIEVNKEKILELIDNNNIGNIVELIESEKNNKYFLEIREKDYIQNKSKLLIFSKIYKIIKYKSKIGIIRESYNYRLYEWLQTLPSNEDIKIIKKQINMISSIMRNNLDKLEYIWIKKVNKGFPVIIKGVKIEHNGFLVGLINTGKKRLRIKEINNEIRVKNLKSLYSEKELCMMYSNICDMINRDIYIELVKNNIDNELIRRRLDNSRIAKLL